MGNKESTNHHEISKIARQTSRKRHSYTTTASRMRSKSIQNAQSCRKLSSFRKASETDSSVNSSFEKKRSKSFRASSEKPSCISARRQSNVCEITGLNPHQKAILTTMWRQLPRSLVFDLGKRVFEIIFERDPNLLIVINLEHLQCTDQWQKHINFQTHAQRFTHALSQSMRNLAEPFVAADRLQEFGAAYVNPADFTSTGSSACIPNSYWDQLSSAIVTTAKEFLHKQHLNASARSLSVDDASKNFFSQVYFTPNIA